MGVTLLTFCGKCRREVGNQCEVVCGRAAALCVGTSGGAAVSRCGAAPWHGWQLRVQGVTQLRVYL